MKKFVSIDKHVVNGVKLGGYLLYNGSHSRREACFHQCSYEEDFRDFRDHSAYFDSVFIL